jgi:hypothetical protein
MVTHRRPGLPESRCTTIDEISTKTRTCVWAGGAGLCASVNFKNNGLALVRFLGRQAGLASALNDFPLFYLGTRRAARFLSRELCPLLARRRSRCEHERRLLTGLLGLHFLELSSS